MEIEMESPGVPYKIDTLTWWCLELCGYTPSKFPLAIAHLGKQIDCWYPESDRFAMASAVIDNLILVSGCQDEDGTLREKCLQKIDLAGQQRQ
jgi:hypothetical protein